MSTLADTIGNYEVALNAAEKGVVCIPCLPGTKVPAVKWKPYQSEAPDEALLRRWFRDARNNIAILCTGMVLFDCESPEKAELVLRECGDTPYKVRTGGGGVHLGFRRRKGSNVINQVRIKGLDIDIRTDGGLALIPNSVTEKGAYQWLGQGLLPIAELPVANIGWTRERVRRVVRRLEVAEGPRCTLVARARAYLATVEGAISGHGGHNRCFRAACVLTQKFGLTYDEAWPLLVEWNDFTCEPPFNEKELDHKLRDAIKRGT